ncbi:chorismate--pyruvate lyase family protein [Sulfuricystis multivorans]|uniref:chorismate--pyruvate lyase family protein n=1 Tax=Sulfuricystis multivorans TaxID=2211108 RepID=UPI000F84E27F|nr:chorismate lyase [Sulfuricystis multivorans]
MRPMVASLPFPPHAALEMSRQEFRWKPDPALAGAPAWLRPWLADPGSLTARIVLRCTSFEVRVLGERRAPPLPDERTLIGLPLGRYAWTREVLLFANGLPVVFAHSVLAPRDLNGAWHMAQAIGSRPLGAALFADPSICRGPLSAARLTARHPLHRHAEQALGEPLPTLWARRSRFCRLGRPLLVTEVFLPGIARL